MALKTVAIFCFLSLLSQFQDDHLFDINMRVRVRGVKEEQDVLQVEKTCTHDNWAPREVLCDRNYMEVNPCLK